ncbi:MAG: hypothetical protein K5829_05205 [Treponema sp.]|nr:hypothetical protein [Treponema sp.]
MKTSSLRILFFIFYSFFIPLSAKSSLHPDPWSLIIYRPDNSEGLNDIRCWIKLEDFESGEDVTYTKAKANYEFVADRKKAAVRDTSSISAMFKYTGQAPSYNYKKTYYLSGGMAMHLLLQAGKYKITFYTPKDHAMYFPTSNKGDWTSNEFIYDTENPAKVIFLSPTANDNGFYNGGWHIDYKAPKFWKVTKGYQE